MGYAIAALIISGISATSTIVATVLAIADYRSRRKRGRHRAN